MPDFYNRLEYKENNKDPFRNVHLIIRKSLWEEIGTVSYQLSISRSTLIRKVLTDYLSMRKTKKNILSIKNIIDVNSLSDDMRKAVSDDLKKILENKEYRITENI